VRGQQCALYRSRLVSRADQPTFYDVLLPGGTLFERANPEYRIVKRFAISIAIHEVPRDSLAEEPR